MTAHENANAIDTLFDAINWERERSGVIELLGFRLAAAYALLAAGRSDEAAELVAELRVLGKPITALTDAEIRYLRGAAESSDDKDSVWDIDVSSLPCKNCGARKGSHMHAADGIYCLFGPSRSSQWEPDFESSDREDRIRRRDPSHEREHDRDVERGFARPHWDESSDREDSK